MISLVAVKEVSISPIQGLPITSEALEKNKVVQPPVAGDDFRQARI